MSEQFQVKALPAGQFAALWELSASELQQRSAQLIAVDSEVGYPCRISLQDAPVGEQLIAMPYVHHPVKSFFRASGPIYIRRQVPESKPAPGEIPSFLASRLISIRAYDSAAMLHTADVVSGDQLDTVIPKLLSVNQISYLHLHNARPGCYLCEVTRLPDCTDNT